VPDCVHNATWTSNAHTVAGGRGVGPTSDRLHSPKGLCVNENQVVFIADASNHRIMKHYPGATGGIAIVGSTTSGYACDRLCGPSRRDQSVYVSDMWNNRIMKWSNGATTGVAVAGGHGKGLCRTQLNFPAGLLVDRFGALYVADCWNHRVIRWYDGAPCGSVIAGGNGPGNGVYQLSFPEGLAFDRYGNLYISDSNNHRIQRFQIQKI
ncbi:unnamed protein product, partial [Rotaria sp. Silwood1]